VGDAETTGLSRREFYGEVLTEAEKEALEVAREMEGLAEEAAVLRVKLREALDEEKVDLRLLKYGTDALVKVVAAQYRLSPKSKKEPGGEFGGDDEHHRGLHIAGGSVMGRRQF
jgi:hypothetical protein